MAEHGASPSQISKAIQPGSTESGQRQVLEQGLAELGAGASQAPAPQGGGSLPSPGNPLQSLLSGEVNPGGDVPLTDGLSVGPGLGGDQGAPDSRKERLKLLAQHAESPTLRAGAIAALRRYDNEGL